MAKIAKKTKKAKITSVTIRENRNKDWSPRWDDTESLSATEFLKHYHNAMHYYNIQFSGKDLKPAVLTWMTENGYEKSVITDFKKSKDWRVSTTMGAIASCLSRGMPEQRDDFNKGTNTKEWLINAINKVIDDSKNDIEQEDDADTKPNTPVVSIQERVREATFKMTEEIEDAIEVWMETPEKFDPKQFKILNLLKGKEVKAAHARVIKDYYSFGLKELSEVIEGKDEDLKEGYKHRNKKQINNLLAFYKEIDSACTMLMEEAKVLRKPRAKKAIPKDKIVEKLKFLKTFEPLKLVSVNPTDILGSKELWTYNTKTRKLGKYIADDMTGPLGIKGTTIIGYDEHKSVQKTIRKPEDKLKEFKSAGKIALRKFLEDINATDTKLNGRINEDIILLKVG
jgi:hypothetical protein